MVRVASVTAGRVKVERNDDVEKEAQTRAIVLAYFSHGGRVVVGECLCKAWGCRLRLGTFGGVCSACADGNFSEAGKWSVLKTSFELDFCPMKQSPFLFLHSHRLRRISARRFQAQMQNERQLASGWCGFRR
jgi:hypothetical protein